MEFRQKIDDRLKQFWRRIVLKGVRYSDQYKKLDSYYIVNDPWGMNSPSERYRFAETNRLILEKFGRVSSILEIGCGEGHQSLYLKMICDRLRGFDVSERAVKRAQKRCSGVDFFVGDVFSKEVEARAPYDIVVACEVLYYIKDVPFVLQRMKSMAPQSLLTYFAGEMEAMDKQVLAIPGTTSKVIEFKNSRWRLVWWCSAERVN
jgi:SAM-dependent methyltransferase